MRVVVEVPAWMIADGEYRGLAVGDLREFGFVLDGSEVAEDDGAGAIEQPPDDSAVRARGVVRRLVTEDGQDLGAVLDGGSLFPLLRGVAPTLGTTVTVVGTLLVEPYLWASHGVLWPAFPDAVRLWTVSGMRVLRGGPPDALRSLPGPEDVDGSARYLLELDAAARTGG